MRCFTSKAKHRISSKLYLAKYNKQHRKAGSSVHWITFEWSQVVPWQKVFRRGFIWIHRIWSTDSNVRTTSLPDQREYHTFSLCGMEWRTFSRTVGNTWSMTSSTGFSAFSYKKKKYDHEWFSRVSPTLTKLALCTKIIVGRTPI